MKRNEEKFTIPGENIIGQFWAITFDNQVYNFIVTDQLSLYCPQIGENRQIKSLAIKPNFEICLNGGSLRHAVDLAKRHRGESYYENGEKIPYVAKYIIPEQLIGVLVANEVISYSTDMAYLYGLNPDYACDRKFKGRAFKHVSDKRNILVKQRRGIYN